MKATIDFEPDLYRQLKAAAALRGKKVRELVTEGVRIVLAHPADAPSRRKPKFPLLVSKRKKPLDIPDDAAFRVEMTGDMESHATSL